MELETAQKRVKELREAIDYHSRRYYDEDAPGSRTMPSTL